MSKFRARALDATRALAVHRIEEIPDLDEYAAINRAVPQMPTGMEKEEETERHLQEAMETRQYYGAKGAKIIPTPEVTKSELTSSHKIYRHDVAIPDDYIRVSGLGTEEDLADYDMDSEDETWLNAQSKDKPISANQFEAMMDKLEKGSGNTVLTESEAQALLRDNPDLAVAVYDYWLSKRLGQGHPLVPNVKTEKRDGSTGNNPYIAFRKRIEKMQTRKNRKNDEIAYMHMVKLRRELARVCSLGDQIKEREEKKYQLAQLAMQIFQKRYAIGDWSGAIYGQLAQANLRSPTVTKSVPTKQSHVIEEEWSPMRNKDFDAEIRHIGRHDILMTKKKQKKKKYQKTSLMAVLDKQMSEDRSESLHSEEPHESFPDRSEDDVPDGVFTFHRRSFVKYYKHRDTGNVLPWKQDNLYEPLAKRTRYYRTTFNGQSLGLARRRIARNKRLIWDYMSVKNGDVDLSDSLFSDLEDEQSIKDNNDIKIPLYRSRSPSPTFTLTHPRTRPTPHLPFIREPYRSTLHHSQPVLSSFLTPLGKDVNLDQSSQGIYQKLSFSGQPSSFFNLCQTGDGKRPVKTQTEPNQKPVRANSADENGSREGLEGNDLSDPQGDDVFPEQVEEVPTSLPLKIKIEKHYQSGIIGEKKVTIVVASPEKRDKTKEMEELEPRELPASPAPPPENTVSLEGPVNSIDSLSKMSLPNSSSPLDLKENFLLFGFAPCQLAIPSIFGSVEKSSASPPVTTTISFQVAGTQKAADTTVLQGSKMESIPASSLSNNTNQQPHTASPPTLSAIAGLVGGPPQDRQGVFPTSTPLSPNSPGSPSIQNYSSSFDNGMSSNQLKLASGTLQLTNHSGTAGNMKAHNLVSSQSIVKLSPPSEVT